MAVPAQAIIDAGYDIVVATPKGTQPVVEQFSVKADYFGDSEGEPQKALDFVATSPGLRILFRTVQ
ncbi:MAG: hypothetical protein JWQ86_5545 [Mycobacterium sp.]|nr:hypothetical protein [Mycobacterium sp.]MDT5214623.1 hypothetical protein [Mycobacterium sp.]